MASVPVPVTAEPRDLSTPALPLPGADFLRGAMRLPMARQIVLLVAICASVALGAASVLWMRSADYKQLLDLSDPARSAAVISALEANGIDYRIDDRARMLLVAGDDLYRARMQIAGVSGVSTEPLGYELLDREQTFGQSQMMEAVQYRRGLEGELARNIQSIAVVQQARVLIAQPPQSAFLRNRRKPSASVALTLAPGRLLGEEQIRAITNLVAGAVPELDPEDVSIVDQAGRLLTATVDSPGVNQSLKELDYVERVEARLKRNIYNLLVPSLGSEGFSTELVADVDFTQAEEAAEIYQPEVTSVRSESSTEEMEIGEQVLPVGVPGALANEPVRPSPAADGETVEQEPKRTRSQVTRNYEVDRTVSYTRKQRATIGRLSVSVLIKDRAPLPPAEEGGEAQPNPWSADELARFEALVKGAVGFSEARGDSVTVIAQPFAEIITPAAVTAAFWEQGWFGTLIKQVFGGLVLLMLMIGLLRPLIRNVSQAGAILKEQQALALARMSQENEAAEANAARQALAQDAAGPALPGPAAALSSDGGELGNKFEAIRGLVNDDPERAAQVVKHWVGRDE